MGEIDSSLVGVLKPLTSSLLVCVCAIQSEPTEFELLLLRSAAQLQLPPLVLVLRLGLKLLELSCALDLPFLELCGAPGEIESLRWLTRCSHAEVEGQRRDAETAALSWLYISSTH